MESKEEENESLKSLEGRRITTTTNKVKGKTKGF